MAKKKPKILTANNALKINELISNASGRKREILLELKRLNNLSQKFMTTPCAKYGSKYSLLQQTKEWKQAKKLLIEYFGIDLTCKICKQKIDNHDCILHHSTYKLNELYTPIFVNLIHFQCHEKIHDK